ncbi:YeeE/YedE family protein [Rhodoplanes sp. Z2-YC6860]|uniref:YeeE/YedE family protein n=1 Tax=Rhodoplanes sp. Z2-YC6860 TaxID=674703 RepID=UPI00078D46EA|nr:YeeE/YedE family protein [Rhodoplanes sp. Z2-YC6860]AMN45093.1 YeeE/YedE family protein [Rhodoplanes sp. Z2-YC6860]
MTIAATESATVRLPRLDWPFLIASVLATAVMIALVMIDGQPAAVALILLGFALGVAFLKTEFSFTASWRRLITRGQADGFLGGLLLIAIAATAVVPVAKLVPGFGGAIAPIGPSLIIGAFVFGIGMQLGNGCGSGTLYTVGGGSGRMIITLAFFIAGSVIGSLHLPAFLALGGLDPILAADYLGPWGGLAATWATLAVAAVAGIALARKRGASFKPSRRILIGAVLIGLLSIGVFAAGHHPWSVTFGFTVWGAKLAALAGYDFSGAEFWQWAGPKHALGDSILGDTSSLTDLGMIFGAMAAAAATAPFARNPWPPVGSLLAAAVGGLLMGWGARLGFGCNIGAFVGGLASGSLHGWVWFAAALPGCWIGIKLRPLFGLSRE